MQIRKKTTGRIHSVFSKKAKWYRQWHESKFYKPFHVFLFVLFTLSIAAGIFFNPTGTKAALIEQEIIISESSDFNLGTYQTTQINGEQVELGALLPPNTIDNGNGTWTTTFQPDEIESKDASFNRWSSSVNYNNSTVHGITYNGGGIGMASLLEFDEISTLPASSITDATLSLYAYTYYYGDHNQYYQIHRVTSSWSETGVTYNTRPSVNGSYTDRVIDSGLNKWYDFNVTTDAQYFFSNPGSNYGWQYQMSLTQLNYGTYMRSSAYTTSSLRPKLEITYVPTATGSYESIGTYDSPIDSNVLDMNWIGLTSWNGVTPNFQAEVVVPSAEESIGFEARLGRDDGVGGIIWDNTTQGARNNGWIDLGTENFTTGAQTTFIGNDTAWDELPNDPIENWRYIHIKSTLESSDGNDTPILDSYKITYSTDLNEPTGPNNATVRFEDGGSEITAGDWTNETTPYITFSGASDGAGESGLSGYYVYFGDDPTADPETAGDWVDYGSEVYEPDLGTPTSPNEYYLRVDTVDVAGNKYDMPSGSYLYSYQFDNVDPTDPTNVEKVPVGYTSDNSYTFNWTNYPGSDTLPGSDVCGYEYKTDDVGANWQYTTNTSVSGAFAYQNDENIFRVRTVDCAGNKSSGNMYVRFYYSQDAPGKVQNLTVTPGTNTENSFSFNWDKPLDGEYNGYIKYYHYSVNEAPTTNNHQEIEVAIDHTETTLPADAFATNQGLNTFYIVAVDDSGNVAYDSDHWQVVQFECNTVAPGIPVRVNVIDTSDREVEDWSLTLKWQAPAIGGSVHHYDVYRSDDGGDTYNYRGSATTTTYSESGLSNDVEYKYKVYAVDNAESVSAASMIVSDTPTGKYTNPPNVVTGPKVEATAIGATITWSTDRASSSFVEYSIDGSYSLSNGSLTPKTSHKVELSGLNPSTTYNFRIQSLDEDRDYESSEAYSGNNTFITSTAPGISEVEVSDTSLSSAIVTWKTTSSATSTIKYGTSTSYGYQITDESGSQVTKHTIKLSDLHHSTTYNFKIHGTDIDNNYMESDNYVFSTLIFPRISDVRFEQQKETATSTLKVTWTSNVPLTSIVEFREADGGKTQEMSSAKLKNRHELLVSGLRDNTDYVMTVMGRDAYGNLASSDANKVRTDFDTRPPEIFNITTETEVVGFGLDAKGQLVVSWETDEPSTSQIEYGVGSKGTEYSNRTQIDTSLTTSHVVIISDLKPSSPYHFRIITDDASENTAFSEDYSTLTGQATESILDVLVKSLQATIGWLFRY